MNKDVRITKEEKEGMTELLGHFPLELRRVVWYSWLTIAKRGEPVLQVKRLEKVKENLQIWMDEDKRWSSTKARKAFTQSPWSKEPRFQPIMDLIFKKKYTDVMKQVNKGISLFSEDADPVLRTLRGCVEYTEMAMGLPPLISRSIRNMITEGQM